MTQQKICIRRLHYSTTSYSTTPYEPVENISAFHPLGSQWYASSSEMAATTKEPKYLAYYGIHYFEKGYLDRAMSWPDVTSMAHLSYLMASFQGKDSTIVELLRSSLQSFCQTYVARRNDSGFQVSLIPGEFYCGATPGVNPHATSYITGVGTTRPMNPHHRPSAADGVVEPDPGLLVGGPDQYRDDKIPAGLYTASTPPALCYADVQDSYASKEICINWNAPLVFVSGYFPYTSTSTGILEQEHLHPSAIQLGREVVTLVNAKSDPGAYERTFDATALPSGAYFYQCLLFRLYSRPFSLPCLSFVFWVYCQKNKHNAEVQFW